MNFHLSVISLETFVYAAIENENIYIAGRGLQAGYAKVWSFKNSLCTSRMRSF